MNFVCTLTTAPSQNRSSAKGPEQDELKRSKATTVYLYKKLLDLASKMEA